MSDTQEPSRPWRVFSMALSIFIVSSALVWLSRETGPPPYQPAKRERRDAPKPPPRESEAPPAPRERMDATARAVALDALPPLPAPDTALSEQLAVASQRAFAGDPVAGCRLVLAGARCRVRAESSPPLADPFCAGIGAGDVPSAEAVMERAQAWMTPRQKVLLAMMAPDGTVARLQQPPRDAPAAAGYVHPPYLAERAYEFLLEGFRAFDPLALEGLALIHSPSAAGGWTGTGPSLPNPQLYAFYIGLLERLHGPASLGPYAQLAANARATLPPAQRQRLDRQIDREARLWREAVPPAALTARWEALQREDLELEHCQP